MRTTHLALFGAGALVIVAISAPAAQQSDNNRKKPPKQTQDRGVDDPAPAASVDRKTGERNIEAVTIVQRPGGVVMGILDESFEDALVATVKADGSIVYTCVHGLPAGARHVQTKAPIVSVTPAAEEK